MTPNRATPDGPRSRETGPDPHDSKEPHGPLPEGYARYAGLGVQFAGTMAVLGALGYWADTRFGTAPWLMIVGIFLGAVGGFVSLVKQVPGPGSRPSRPKPPEPPAAR